MPDEDLKKKADKAARLDRKSKEIIKHYKESTSFLNDWLEEAQECQGLRAGNMGKGSDGQWTAQTLSALRANDPYRSALTFNRIGPFVDAIIGLEIQNRQEVRFYPRQQGTAQKSEVVNGAVDWVRDGTDAEYEETDAFGDTVTTGLGWIQTFLDTDENPDGEIRMERRDPRRMRYDINAKKKNLTDRKWHMYVADMTHKDVESEWPDADINSFVGPWDKDIESAGKTLSDQGEEFYLGDDTQPQAEDIVRVVHYQEVAKKPIVRVQVPVIVNGQPQANEQGQIQTELKEFEKADFDANREQLAELLAQFGMPLEFVRQKKRVIKQYFQIGNTIVEEGEAPIPERFNYKAITGNRDHQTGTWYGAVRAMKDPQKWSNKFLSTMIDTVARNAKGGLYAEEDAFQNQRKAEQDWSKPGITWLQQGALAQGRIKEKLAVPYPESLDQLMSYATEAFRDVTGINLELMGLTDRAQANVLEQTRKQSVLTTLAWAFDALALYRKEQGRLLVDMIREFVADGRLIRVIGEQGQEFVPLLKEEVPVDIDLVVDDSPASANVQERNWAALQTILPLALQGGIPVPPAVIDALPLSETLKEEWKAMITPQEPDPQQVEAEQRRQAFVDRLIAAEARNEEAAAGQKEADTILKVEQAKTEAAERGEKVRIEALKALTGGQPQQ